jgi:hypothetical protein
MYLICIFASNITININIMIDLKSKFESFGPDSNLKAAQDLIHELGRSSHTAPSAQFNLEPVQREFLGRVKLAAKLREIIESIGGMKDSTILAAIETSLESELFVYGSDLQENAKSLEQIEAENN